MECVVQLSEGVFSKRFKASLIDVAILILPLPILMLLWFSVLNRPVALLLLGVGIVIYPGAVIYNSVLVIRQRASIGLLCMGLSILNARGFRAGRMQALRTAFPSRKQKLLERLLGLQPAIILALPVPWPARARRVLLSFLGMFAVAVLLGVAHLRPSVQDLLAARGSSATVRKLVAAGWGRLDCEDLIHAVGEVEEGYRGIVLERAIWISEPRNFDALRSLALESKKPALNLRELAERGDTDSLRALCMLLNRHYSAALLEVRYFLKKGAALEPYLIASFEQAEDEVKLRMSLDLSVANYSAFLARIEAFSLDVFSRGPRADSRARAVAISRLTMSESEEVFRVLINGLQDEDVESREDLRRRLVRLEPGRLRDLLDASWTTAEETWPLLTVSHCLFRREPEALEGALPAIYSLAEHEQPKLRERGLYLLLQLESYLDRHIAGKDRVFFKRLFELLQAAKEPWAKALGERLQEQTKRSGYLVIAQTATRMLQSPSERERSHALRMLSNEKRSLREFSLAGGREALKPLIDQLRAVEGHPEAAELADHLDP